MNPSGTPPKAPPQSGHDGPQIDVAVPDSELLPERIREMMCASAKNNATLSDWVTNPHTNMKAKYLTGCIDANDNDPRKKETAYWYGSKTADYPLTANPANPKMTPAVCKAESDYCASNGTRQTTLMQTSCKKNPVTNVWSISKTPFDCSTLDDKANNKYTCKDGACVNVNTLTVDIGVKNLGIKSENCNNYFKFDVCNTGGQDVQSDFKIWLTVNGSKVEITYPASQNKIRAGQCVTITEPQKFSILAFGLGLNQTATVSVEANPAPRQVSELNFANNLIANSSVNTGAEWMLNATVRCDTFCYETDYITTLLSGRNLKQQGTMFTTNQGFAYQRTDFCASPENGLIWEFYCKTPTIINGVATDLIGIDIVKCADAFAAQGVPGVCKDGACVEADRYNVCTDTEIGNSTTANGTLTYSTPMPAGPNGYNPNQSFPLQTIRDTCASTTHVREEYCGAPDYPNLRITATTACDSPQTPGYVCDPNQGICVPAGSCSCVMKDSSGNTVLTNLLNRNETTTRTCNGTVLRQDTDRCFGANSTTLFQFRCDSSGNFVTDTIDCSTQGSNWGCHEGQCIAPNEALKTCTDSDTQGVPDYPHFGSIKQTDAYGNQRADVDESCDADGFNLNEWYCGADKTAKAIRFDCRTLGNNFVCRNGACVTQ